MLLDQAAERARTAVVQLGVGFNQREDMGQNLLQRNGLKVCLQMLVDGVDDQPLVLLLLGSLGGAGELGKQLLDGCAHEGWLRI